MEGIDVSYNMANYNVEILEFEKQKNRTDEND